MANKQALRVKVEESLEKLLEQAILRFLQQLLIETSLCQEACYLTSQ